MTGPSTSTKRTRSKEHFVKNTNHVKSTKKCSERHKPTRKKEQLSPQVHFYPPFYVVSFLWSINGFVPLLPPPPPHRSPVSWANNLLSFFFSSWQQRLRRRYLFPWSFPSDQRPSIFPFSLSLGVVAGGSPPSSVFRPPPLFQEPLLHYALSRGYCYYLPLFSFCVRKETEFWETGFIHIEKLVVVVVDFLIEALSQPFSLFLFCNGRRLSRIPKYPKSPFSTFGGKGSECCGLNHHHAVLWGVERGLKALQRGVWGGKKKRGVEGNQDSPLRPSSPIHSTLRHKEASRGEEGTFQTQDST